jgi:hypothetical protein
MKLLGKVFTALLFCALLGKAEASTEWVKLVTDGSEGYVVSAYDNTYMIDVGISMGARRGGLYLAYAEGSEIYDTNGAIVGRYKIPLAVLRVREPSTTHSFCVILPPTNGFIVQPGDRVVPISARRARQITFATTRVAAPVPVGAVPAPIAAPFPAPAPASVIAKYDEYWAPANVPVAAPQAPGYYYMNSPVPPPIESLRVSAARPATGYPPSAPQQAPVMPAVSQQPLSPPPGQPYPPYQQYPAAPPQQPFQAPSGSPYPPYPSYPATSQVMLDFDANKIADARLIRTFPLSQVEMNALEIEHRGAWNLYSNGRYMEAFDAYSQQSVNFRGNYLSPYWAGMSALKLGNIQVASAWFDMALGINPYFAPARNAKLNGPRYLLEQQNAQQKKQPARKAPRRRARARK